MSNNFNSIRFLPNHDAVTLNRKSASRGEVFYDPTTVSLRVYDGTTVGGYQILRSDFSNIEGSVPSTAFGPGSIGNAKLANSKVTVGTTDISLGASVTTIAGLVSVTSTTFVGALTGNASTATKLSAARNINGVAFDGSADISIASTSLVNGSKSAILGVDGGLTLNGYITSAAGKPLNILASTGSYATFSNASGSKGLFISDPNVLITNETNTWTFGTDGSITMPGAQFGSSTGIFGFTLTADRAFTVTGIATGNTVKTFTIGADGNVTVQGKVTATELDVTTSGAITAGTVTTEYAVINGYATISNKPTTKTQVTNKAYVDKRATAMAVALS
jgi:hypothetical protein